MSGTRCLRIGCPLTPIRSFTFYRAVRDEFDQSIMRRAGPNGEHIIRLSEGELEVFHKLEKRVGEKQSVREREKQEEDEELERLDMKENRRIAWDKHNASRSTRGLEPV